MKNLFIYIALLTSLTISAQQTSQTTFFNESRAFWNPAYTGFDNKVSYNGFIRQQWLGFGLNAPRSVFADFQYPFVDYNMAASGGLQYDQTGPVSKRGVVLNYAYHLKDLNDNEASLSLGITAGGFQYVYNPSKEVVLHEDDPSLLSGTKSGFYPSIGGGLFYQSSSRAFKGNSVFYFGGSFIQGYQTNVLVEEFNQKRVSHLTFEAGTKIYGYDYFWQPSISVNYTSPDIMDVLAGVVFEMRDKFWAGAGYSSVRELSVQGGYIINEIGGRDTRLRIGVLGNIGLGDKLENFGPGAELFARYELDL